MTCLQCKELYKINNQTYYPYWCKLFKCYLLLDKECNPERLEDCKILVEDK